MAEIDLIPLDYRMVFRMRKRLRFFLAALLLVTIGVTTGRVWLNRLVRSERAEIARLKVGEEFLLDQRRVFEELGRKKTKLESRLGVLDALRGGPSAESMFVVVDRAMNGALWFTEWRFTRAEKTHEEENEPGTQGYFIVVDPKKRKEEAPWRNATRMEIRGEGLSHSALAAFVKKLLLQPEILDVHVLNTGARNRNRTPVVEFELAVVVNT